MAKKILFIDRDGTIIIEPKDYQIDSFDKLEFYPGAISNLSKIVQELEFDIVMVTNQDGLGTKSFPEENFYPIQNFILKTLENEGIIFREICIDRTFEQDNAPTRKPGIGMLYQYKYGDFDLVNSYVIGDRNTDVLLAKNLGCQSIFIGPNNEDATFSNTNWSEIYAYLKQQPRVANITRVTKETHIDLKLNLDGRGSGNIRTGLPFFDHMLDQLVKHANIDLELLVNGDLAVDDHHTIEDTALALGAAIKDALRSKKGINRYGFLLPMDDCLAQVAIDFGGRPWLVWDVEFKRSTVGSIATEMWFHFFKSFSDAAQCNMNIKVEGDNEHHKIESIFKAWAKAIQQAITQNNNFQIPSTKGIL